MGAILRDAIGGALGAVGSAKGVVHKDIAQGGQLAGQLFLVLLLADIDAAVFQQHHLARGHGHAVHPVGKQRHVAAQQLGQALGHGSQRVFGLERAFGRAAQVAGHHHGGARVQGHADARNRGADAGVFGNVTGGRPAARSGRHG
jgi:hypothetical protein